MPAGILSPYSDGERDALIDDFASRRHCKKGAGAAVSPFSPLLYGGEVPRRAMRGSADFDNWWSFA
ncbi:MAG: hypothetical protein EOQ92_17495 [Mesorhizobium sp.]|nr:MAG: hypothetical protein EOQ92_17495 [Mesorhizobium sp.]